MKALVEDLESDKAVLIIENDGIKEQYEQTLRKMSIQEAEWCEKEEQLKLKVKAFTPHALCISPNILTTSVD